MSPASRILPLCALAALAAPGCAPRAERPSFVLCMSDDQGWGDVGYRGATVLETPTLDAMAAAGVRLERFYAASPVCSPTRASVLTGRHPNRFGCFTWGSTLQPGELTLAEVLRDAGYATGHFGKWHLGSIHPDSPYNPGANGFEEWFSNPNFFEGDPWMSHNGQVAKASGEGSRVVVDAALEFIRAATRGGRPFLAVVWFSAPHAPYRALPEDLARYASLPAEVQGYYAELTAMDRALGHLRDGLRALGIEDRTLLWFTSDNGPDPAVSTGGLNGSKGSLGEGGLRVPCILEWPTHLAPRASPVPCGTVDIYPTVLALAGVNRPRGQKPLDGISLVPLLQGDEAPRPKPLGFWSYAAEGTAVSGRVALRAQVDGTETWPPVASASPAPRLPEDERAGAVAWIDGDYKLQGRVDPSGTETYTLIDLARDPEESEDLAAREPERFERMKSALQAWQRSVVRSFNGQD